MNQSEVIERHYAALQAMSGAVDPYHLTRLGHKYTGHYLSPGAGTSVTTPVAAGHISVAIALSKHTDIDDILAQLISVEPGQENSVDQLFDEKVLAGVKILDLGCGPAPLFARCTRGMGATVYTVDTAPVDAFEYHGASEELISAEKKHHISLDLGLPGALDQLLKETGGEFDLVTEACAIPNPDEYRFEGWRLSLPLLKQEGLYCKDHHMFNHIRCGERFCPNFNPIYREHSSKEQRCNQHSRLTS